MASKALHLPLGFRQTLAPRTITAHTNCLQKQNSHMTAKTSVTKEAAVQRHIDPQDEQLAGQLAMRNDSKLNGALTPSLHLPEGIDSPSLSTVPPARPKSLPPLIPYFLTFACYFFVCTGRVGAQPAGGYSSQYSSEHATLAIRSTRLLPSRLSCCSSNSLT